MKAQGFETVDEVENYFENRRGGPGGSFSKLVAAALRPGAAAAGSRRRRGCIREWSMKYAAGGRGDPSTAGTWAWRGPR